jgi:hypothetical protein
MRVKLFIILFFIAGAFFFGSTVHAGYLVDQQENNGSNVLYWSSGWRVSGQRITPGHDNIAKIQFNSYAFNASSTTITICKGTPNNLSQADVEANALTCNWAGNTLLYTGVLAVVATTTADEYVITLPAPVHIDTIGGNYYWVMSHGTVAYHNDPRYYSSNSGLILNNAQWGGSLRYKTYYSTTYVYVPPVSYQLALLTPSPTAPFTTYNGMPASYTFNYENPLNWYPQIRFMVQRRADPLAHAWPNYVNSATFTTQPVASSTLTFGTASFQLPDGVYDLDAYFWGNIPVSPVHATSTFTINTGGTYGGYSFATTSAGQLIIPPTLTEEQICGNIATSTTFGAIECGLMKALYGAGVLLFTPSFDTLQNFRASYELFKGCFPFNTFFQLTNTITGVASSTASSTAGTIKIPFIHTNGTYYMMPVMSSTTLSNWIGVSNYNLFRTTIGYFFWLVAVAIVFFTVKYI